MCAWGCSGTRPLWWPSHGSLMSTPAMFWKRSPRRTMMSTRSTTTLSRALVWVKWRRMTMMTVTRKSTCQSRSLPDAATSGFPCAHLGCSCLAGLVQTCEGHAAVVPGPSGAPLRGGLEAVQRGGDASRVCGCAWLRTVPRHPPSPLARLPWYRVRVQIFISKKEREDLLAVWAPRVCALPFVCVCVCVMVVAGRWWPFLLGLCGVCFP